MNLGEHAHTAAYILPNPFKKDVFEEASCVFSNRNPCYTKVTKERNPRETKQEG